MSWRRPMSEGEEPNLTLGRRGLRGARVSERALGVGEESRRA